MIKGIQKTSICSNKRDHVKSLVLSIFLMASFVGKVQAQLNEYKYIVVPKRFSCFKKENQHQTSTLVKHLFSNKGFKTAYEGNLPEDLSANRCLGLYVDLVDDSSMFTTKASLTLKDCTGKEIFLTRQGRSKQKEYKEAFKEAITEAFGSFDAIGYSYKPKANEDGPVTVSFKNDVKKLEEKPKFDKYQDPMVKQDATLERQSYKDLRPVESDIKKAAKNENKMVDQKATQEEQSYKSVEPVTSDIKKSETSTNVPTGAMAKSSDGVLYAQELSNGYQLVDSTPKIRFRIYKSSMPNVYLAEADGKDGLVYSMDGKWFFEYSKDGNLVIEELNIKF